MDRDLERCLAVVLERDELLAVQLERLDGMTVALDPEIPQVWDANYVRLDRPGLPVDEILGAADEWIGGAGMSHRTIAALDRTDGERLAAELQPRGWEVERDLYMLLRRKPDRPPPAAAEELPLQLLDDVRRELLRVDVGDAFGDEYASEEVVEQLLSWDRKLGAVEDDRWFAATHDGEIASCCRLLSRGAVGQVENVSTLPRARGNGLARSVVIAAAEASAAMGNGLTFLIADADGWPKEMYCRRGFDAVGSDMCFYLKPSPAA